MKSMLLYKKFILKNKYQRNLLILKNKVKMKVSIQLILTLTLKQSQLRVLWQKLSHFWNNSIFTNLLKKWDPKSNRRKKKVDVVFNLFLSAFLMKILLMNIKVYNK